MPSAVIDGGCLHGMGLQYHRKFSDCKYISYRRKVGEDDEDSGNEQLLYRLWDPISRKMFGESCGFQNVFYPREKGAYRMDVVACPYNRYFTELGCPELTKIFCENDERTYGNLPGLQFIRTSTLGKGGERCDFYLKKV